jgi:molybdopterin/thiamine biosynthesis adenylyltransferase
MAGPIVTIVGVGALGSHLIQFLRNEDVKLKVIDFDRVEQRNIQSQFHAKTSVGKKKVEGLAQTMKFLYGRLVFKVSNKLTKDNVDQLLHDADLIVDCLDNGEARRLVQGFARARGRACVHGALAADGAFGRVVWDEDFTIDDENVEGEATCAAGEFLPFIAIVSAYLARVVQIHLEDGRKVGYSISNAGATRL